MTFFLPSLDQQGLLNQVSLTLCIVGSRKLSDENYASGGWQFFGPRLKIYGIDADPDACEAINRDLAEKQNPWQERHIPAALWSSAGTKTLYMTQSPACSSLFQPNTAYIDRLTGYSEQQQVVSQIEVETMTLDALCQAEAIDKIDFLQLDVQGAELAVLQGAASLLARSVLAVVSEVEFNHTYLGQPLFSDIDQHLRQQGFSLFDLYIAAGRSRYRDAPIMSEFHPGVLVWADAFYFRDLLGDTMPLDWRNPANVLKLACMADILQFYDYALELFEYLTVNFGSDPAYNFADGIVQALSQMPELVDRGLAQLPVIHRLKDHLVRYRLERTGSGS